jgi:hypothetical protein
LNIGASHLRTFALAIASTWKSFISFMHMAHSPTSFKFLHKCHHSMRPHLVPPPSTAHETPSTFSVFPIALDTFYNVI